MFISTIIIPGEHLSCHNYAAPPKKNNYNDEIIPYKKIDDPRTGVKYVVNDHVKFQILVIEKY